MKQNVEDLKKLYNRIDFELANIMELAYKNRHDALKMLKEDPGRHETQRLIMIESVRICEIIYDFVYKILDNDIKREDIKKSTDYVVCNFLMTNINENISPFDYDSNIELADKLENLFKYIDKLAEYENVEYIHEYRIFNDNALWENDKSIF